MFLLISCYIADLILGDPEWFPHPVRGIGKLISLLDKGLRRNNIDYLPEAIFKLLRGENAIWVERMRGMILTFVVVGISTGFAYLFIEFSKKLNPLLGSLAWLYLGYTVLSVKDLQVKAKAILRKLRKDSISGARSQLSKIVGRDTQNMGKDRIIVAAIESIAESINDGIVAPLFYLILGGPVLAIAYKSINTLDSMVGYKSKEYLHFGWFSARLDDIANYIPARISGFLISVSSLISGKSFRGSFGTMLRDGRKHISPNSGISEAAMAGALGIRLGGTWSYHGIVSTKPYLGEEKRVIQPSFINEALWISFITSILMVSIGVVAKWMM